MLHQFTSQKNTKIKRETKMPIFQLSQSHIKDNIQSQYKYKKLFLHVSSAKKW